MLCPAGSAQRTRYDSVLRPAAEFIRYVDDVRPVVDSGFTTSAWPVSPLPDRPLPDSPLPDSPLVMVRPLTIVRPLVATISLSIPAAASSLPGAWHPANTVANASAAAMRVVVRAVSRASI